MSRLSADPAAMTGTARAVTDVAGALDGTRSAVVAALLQVAAAGGPAVSPAAVDAARRWQAALGQMSGSTAGLGVGLRRAAACYADVEAANGSWSW